MQYKKIKQYTIEMSHSALLIPLQIVMNFTSFLNVGISSSTCLRFLIRRSETFFATGNVKTWRLQSKYTHKRLSVKWERSYVWQSNVN